MLHDTMHTISHINKNDTYQIATEFNILLMDTIFLVDQRSITSSNIQTPKMPFSLPSDSLWPRGYGCNWKWVNFKHNIVIGVLVTEVNISLERIPGDLADGKPTLGRVPDSTDLLPEPPLTMIFITVIYSEPNTNGRRHLLVNFFKECICILIRIKKPAFQAV